MFFYKKKKHKKHKNGGKCYDTSGCIKGKFKKRFGLTSEEMNDLIDQMVFKSKIPIVQVL
jgi:hypothetical protein